MVVVCRHTLVCRSGWKDPPGKGTCQTKRQRESEQIHRLSVKTLNQVFVAPPREGLRCSPFEARALTELVQDEYPPWLTLGDEARTHHAPVIWITTAPSVKTEWHTPISLRSYGSRREVVICQLT